MGQKVNPHGLRVGVIKDWDSRWFVSKKDIGDTIVEDYRIREYIKKNLFDAGIARTEIERDSARVRVIIHAAKPGVVIGRAGAEIAKQLEERVSFRRAMKQAMQRAMRMGAKGIKTEVSGRLGGADIARVEHYHDGTIPLQTLRADIDYGFAIAHTTYGCVGVKAWIYNGEVLSGAKKAPVKEGGKK